MNSKEENCGGIEFKYNLVNRIKQLYSENGNLMEYMRRIGERNSNTIEDIMIAYDFQTGIYNNLYRNNRDKYEKYHCELTTKIEKYIKKIIESGCNGFKILEAGVGEGTSFGPILKKLEYKPLFAYGFDISWSRIKECNIFLDKLGVYDRYTFVGDMFNIPLKDNSIDIVYTVHPMEPNGGKEIQLLKELYRVASKFIILIEPSYELANQEQRERMTSLGYVKNLTIYAEKLGYKVVEHQLLQYPLVQMNPSAFIVIEKKCRYGSS